MTQEPFKGHRIGFASERGIESVVLRELDAQETTRHVFIGTAYGQGIGHCLLLGKDHLSDFSQLVKAYFVHEAEDERLAALRLQHPNTIRVDLYGDLIM